MNQNNGNEKTITGKDNPLVSAFKQLRHKALLAPFLSNKWTAEDVDVNYYGQVVNYNSSYVLAAIVLVFADGGVFKWFIQTQFVGKKSQKNVSFNLLTRREKETLKRFSNIPLDLCESKKREQHKRKDCLIWTACLSDNELSRIKWTFREYVEKQREVKSDGDN